MAPLSSLSTSRPDALATRAVLVPTRSRVKLLQKKPLVIRKIYTTRISATAEVVKGGQGSQMDTSKLPKISLGETICLQGFGWDSCKGAGGKQWWSVVQEKVADIKAAGFTHVWLPPPSQSVAPQGYLPGQLYNLKSSYGTQEQLMELNRALLEAGIRPVADIVINHRCADEQDENGKWTQYRDDVDHNGKAIDWGKWAITNNDPDFRGDGNPDTGEDYGAAPDLDHLNPDLRDSLVDWLTWMHETMGFQGWRFDFVRGYAAKYTAEYIERTIGPDTFNVGENFVDLRWNGSHLDYNQDDAVNRLCNWVKEAKYCSAFDFPNKGIVQEAIKNTEYDRLRGSNNRGPGMMGAWPEMAVTFVDNHDTGSSQQHWPWPNDYVMLGYAYILTHPGIPCVFWEHVYDWKLKDEIFKLVAIRKRNNVLSGSKVEIQCAEKDLYVAKINDRVVVKLGPRYDMGNLVPNSNEFKVAASGKDFCVWERTA